MSYTRLSDALKEIAKLDYASAATNLSAYGAHLIAKKAIEQIRPCTWTLIEKRVAGCDEGYVYRIGCYKGTLPMQEFADDIEFYHFNYCPFCGSPFEMNGGAK